MKVAQEHAQHLNIYRRKWDLWVCLSQWFSAGGDVRGLSWTCGTQDGPTGHPGWTQLRRSTGPRLGNPGWNQESQTQKLQGQANNRNKGFCLGWGLWMEREDRPSLQGQGCPSAPTLQDHRGPSIRFARTIHFPRETGNLSSMIPFKHW